MSIRSRLKTAWAGIRGKTAPAVGYGGTSTSFFGYGSAVPNPTRIELIQQFRESVFACAMINAAAMASVPLKLYATTKKGRPEPKCATRKVTRDTYAWLKANPNVAPKLKEGSSVVEIEEHPLLDLLESGNKFMDGFTLGELTQLYQEIEGNSYWYLERGPLGVEGLWVLPSHLMQTMRDPKGLPIGYQYGAGIAKSPYKLDEIIAFRMPSLSDPYGDGYSPLRAIWESSQLAIDNSAYTRAAIDDRGWLNTLVTPKEAIGGDEADRMRGKIKKMMMLGKQGGPMVSEQAFDIKQLTSQIDTLAVYGLSKETIANGYGVPLSLLTKDTNLANLAAAREQHGLYGVLPRCRRYEARLNKDLVPLYDDRLFLAFDNPVPEDTKSKSTIRESNLRMGITTINEERASDNLPPVEWGDKPFKGMGGDPKKQGEGSDENGDKPEEKPKKPKPSDKPGAGTDPKKAFEAMCAWVCNDMTTASVVISLCDAGYTQAQAEYLTRKIEVKEVHDCCAEHAPCVTNAEWHKKSGIHSRKMSAGADLQTFLVETFGKQRREVLGSLDGKTCKSFWDTAISLAKWDKYIAEGAKPYVLREYMEGLRDALLRLGSSADPASLTPKMHAAVDRMTLAMAESTNKTTAIAVNEAIAKLRADLNAGTVLAENTMPELVRRVSAVFETAEKYRAERIAKTEVSRALHEGQKLAAVTSGKVVGFRWLPAADACSECLDIVAATPDGVKIGTPFEVKGDGPYDTIEHPPAHPNCMCTMVEIMGESNES